MLLTRYRHPFSRLDSRAFSRDIDRSFASLDQLRREMNRLFADQDPRAAAGLAPALSLDDDGEALCGAFDLPGIKPEDVEITLDNGVLTLKAERKLEPPEGYSAHRRERFDLQLSQSLTLPCEVEADKIEANLKNGVLQLRLPKAAVAKPRRIAIS